MLGNYGGKSWENGISMDSWIRSVFCALKLWAAQKQQISINSAYTLVSNTLNYGNHNNKKLRNPIFWTRKLAGVRESCSDRQRAPKQY